MSNTVLNQLNRSDLNTLADLFRTLKLGNLLSGQIPQAIRRRDPAALAYVDSSLLAVQLPDTSKAASILRATVIAGGVTGELVVKLYGVTPATGEIAVAPNGDLVTLASDAITSVDITYVPERGEAFEITLPVNPSTGVLTIPAKYVTQGVLLLAEAESLEGTLVQKMEVLVPTSSAPATTNARLSIAKDKVYFAVADAVTSARVKLILAPPVSEDLAAALAADATV